MPLLDTLFGYQALPADRLDGETSNGTTATATATLKSHGDAKKAWVIPVALQRDAEGNLVPAPEWIPTGDWQVQMKSYPAKSDLFGGATVGVAFDFSKAAEAEGAAVLFVVQAPTLLYLEYMNILSSAAKVLNDMGELRTAKAVTDTATNITKKLNLVDTKTLALVETSEAADGSKGTDGSASLTELEALKKALVLSLYRTVIRKPNA
jgi:hypothetical protein